MQFFPPPSTARRRCPPLPSGFPLPGPFAAATARRTRPVSAGAVHPDNRSNIGHAPPNSTPTMTATEPDRPRLLQPPRRTAAAASSRPGIATDTQLWTAATQRARLGARVIPGLAEVVEKIGPCPTHGDIAVTFATRIIPDSRGEPMARLVESAGRRTESAFEPLVRHAHGLLDAVESALVVADPLVGTGAGAVRRSMQRTIDGVACVGFTAARRTAGLDLEFSVWIAARHGHAVRVDFRGLNLRDRSATNRIASVYGMRRYGVDHEGRWILVGQTDRLTFVTDDPALPASGYAERTSAYGEHWDQSHQPAPTAPAAPTLVG